MRAVVQDRYGSPDILRFDEIDAPVLNDDAVLVRVRASSVNAYDWHMLRGKPYVARVGEGLRRPKATRVLGVDVAGIAEAVGANVTHVKPGDRVFGARSGAFAEMVVGKNVIAMPEGLSFEQAAAVPTAGYTALQGLRDKGGMEARQRVLINGAGGGVGTLAVQIAKAFGAVVTAVTSTGNLDLMRTLGADHVVDYTAEDFTSGPVRYDLILDAGGNRPLSRLRRSLTATGRIVMVAPGRGDVIGPITRMAAAVVTSRFSSKKAIGFLAAVNREDLVVLRDLLEAGKLTPVIDRTYPFDQIPEAIRYVEAGSARGKVVITV